MDKSSLPGLVVYGAGGHAVSVAELVQSAGYRLLAFVDAGQAGSSLLDTPIVAADDTRLAGCEHAVVAIGDNAVRQRVAAEIRARRRGVVFPTLVHASASVSAYARLGEGCVVMQNASVGSNARLGAFCIVNTGASLDHDGVMEDGASLAPRAVTGGRVSIGLRSAVAIGAVVKHGIVIGSDSVLGANSYLNVDLPSGQVAWGSPACIVRSRQPGDRYLD